MILLTGAAILTFFIFKPFLYVLVLAIVFVTIFDPLHKKALARLPNRKYLAALLPTFAILLIVVIPLIVLGTQIFREATGLYASLTHNGGTSALSEHITSSLKSITSFSPIPLDLSLDINQYLKQGLGWAFQHLGPLFANVAQALIEVFIFFISLYFLFKDGHRLKTTIINLSPLQDSHNAKILNHLYLAIHSIIKGGLVVALIQGTLVAIGFTIFGVPNALLWGSVAAIAALIPGIGTSLVVVPAVLYLYWSGAIVATIGLLIWGSLAVGLIDNAVGPKLIGQGVKIHQFLVLLSVLGGISFFGPVGYLLGPLVLSLLLTLLEIYLTIKREAVAKIQKP